MELLIRVIPTVVSHASVVDVLVIIRGLLEAPEPLDIGDAPTPLVVSV